MTASTVPISVGGGKCGSPALEHRNGFPRASLILLFLLCASAITTWGQSSAALWHGVLRDSAGAPIDAATVRLADSRGQVEAVTRSDGRFQLTLPTGKYRLALQAGNHRTEYAEPIYVTSGSPAVVLTLSDRGELSVAPLKADQAAGGEDLSSQTVSELPLNKRDFSALLLLAAGTMTDTNGATNFTAQFAINGQRGVEATFAMDGADISDPEMGGSTFSNFNVDAFRRSTPFPA